MIGRSKNMRISYRYVRGPTGAAKHFCDKYSCNSFIFSHVFCSTLYPAYTPVKKRTTSLA